MTAQLAAVRNTEEDEGLDARIAVLKGFPLFGELEHRELGLIAGRMADLTLAPQTQILTQNEDAEAVYFLTQGAVKILINGEMVAQVDTVQCFGEMSCLVPGTPASASVMTAKESHVFKVAKKDFLEVVNQIPRLWKTLFLQMNGRFKAVNMRLSEVLEHTPQGLVKVDRKGVITNEYSIQCTRYFGKDNLAGISFAELTHPGQPEQQELWEQTYPMLFDDSGALSFEDIAGLLDAEIKIKLGDGTTKEFVLSYYPCRNLAGATEAIDIGVEDVTEARELERKNAQMLAEQAAMGKIYDNPESFLNLKKFVVETLAASIEYFKGVRAELIELDSDATRDYLRKLHSLKGYAGVFALKPVQEATHQLEELLKRAQSEGTLSDDGARGFARRLGALKEAYAKTETMFNRIGESLRKRLLGIPFSPVEFAALKDAAARSDVKEIVRLTQAVERIDCLKLVSAWSDEAAKIAATLGKEVELTIDGDGGSVSKHVFEDLDSVLVHLLRNSIAHGIETSEERQEAGKPAAGGLRVTIEVMGEESGQGKPQLRFEIADDGRGIDFAELADLAMANEKLDPAAIKRCVEAGEPWRILFLSGFTTSEEVSELAGRGIGLSALKALVDSYHGSITVSSKPREGTTFRIFVPLEVS